MCTKKRITVRDTLRVSLISKGVEFIHIYDNEAKGTVFSGSVDNFVTMMDANIEEKIRMANATCTSFVRQRNQLFLHIIYSDK